MLNIQHAWQWGRCSVGEGLGQVKHGSTHLKHMVITGCREGTTTRQTLTLKRVCVLFFSASNTEGITHIKTSLCPLLLSKQHRWDPQLQTAQVCRLNVLEALAQPHVAPDGLHHAQAQRVEPVAYAEGGDLGRDSGSPGLVWVGSGLMFLSPTHM